MSEPVDISVVLVSYNTAPVLADCLRRLEAGAPAPSREIIVVDNASRDGSAEVVRRRFPHCRLIENAANLGFGRAANQGVQCARGRYVLFLNTDAFVERDSLEKTVAYMDAHPGCGILGAKLVGVDGRLQPSARYFPTPWNIFLQRTGFARFARGARLVDDMAWDHASVRPCDWVPGCFYLVRRAVLEQIGPFDPRYFLYYEEVDQCLAAKRAGWQVVFYPHTTVVHLQGASAREEGELTGAGHAQVVALQVESELLYFRKNHGLVGLLAHLALSTLCDALIVASRLVKRRLAHAAGPAGHAALVWSLFGRTRFGSQPTR